MPRRLKAAFAAALLIALPSQVAPQDAFGRVEPRTRTSGRIQSLQALFNREAADVTTVIIDRDWFEANLALAGRDIHDAAARDVLLAEYIATHTGLPVDPARLSFLDRMTAADSGRAFVVGTNFLTGRQDFGQQRVCIAFGHASHSDAAAQAARFTGLNTAIHRGLDPATLRPPQLDVLNAYTDMHEAAHCLDDNYLTQLGQAADMNSRVALRHRAEMYAEVLATLLLAREGRADVAHARADLRLAGMALNGPIARRHYDPGRDVEYYSSHIYALDGALRATQREIDRRGAGNIAALTLAELRALAFRLTEENAVDAARGEALGRLQDALYDLRALERRRGRSAADEDIYLQARQVRADMNAALSRLFDFGRARSAPLDRIRFDFAAPAIPADAAPGNPGALRDRLIARAGGSAATPDALVAAYAAMKDALRAQLSASSRGTRADAARDLDLMGEALKRASQRVPGARKNIDVGRAWTDRSGPAVDSARRFVITIDR